MCIKYLLFTYLIYLFSIKRSSNLYCGLFGYSGIIPPNLAAIKILGMYNIARGTDSCGIMIDNNLYKGVGVESNWLKFIERNTFNEPKEDFTIIGHTRKATVGANSKNNAHPFAFYKDEYDTDTFFIGAHNGTISNTEDLCKKYGLEEKDYDVDSQVLLAIISDIKTNKKNLEVFKQYKGAAALLFKWIDEPNALYAFHGKSLTNSYAVTATEERPLYYYKIKGKDQVYLSSIKESLLAIGGSDDSVKEVEHNKLYKFNAGKVSIMKADVDRSTVVTTEEVFTSGNQYNNSRVGTSTTSANTGTTSASYGHQGNTIKYDPSYQKECIKNTFIDFPQSSLDKVVIPNPDIYLATTELTGKTYSKINSLSSSSFNVKPLVIDLEPLPTSLNDFKGKIIFWKGRYYKNGHVLGKGYIEEIMADLNGYPAGHGNFREANSPKKYFFFYGNMIKDESCAKKLKELIDAGRIMDKTLTQAENDAKMSIIIESDTLKLFDNLVTTRINDSQGSFRMASRTTTISGGILANGDYVPHFYRGIVYTFTNGWFMSAKYDSSFKEELKPNTTNEEVEDTTKRTMTSDELATLLEDCYSVKNKINRTYQSLEAVEPNDLLESKQLSKFYSIFKNINTYVRGRLYNLTEEDDNVEEDIRNKSQVF